MPIESRQLGNEISLVMLSGRLVFGKEVDKLESAVKALIGLGQKRYIFDASGLEYMDSSGIGSLVACLGDIRNSGGDLRLAGVSPRIQRLLQMTGVDKLLPTFPTVADAM